MKFDAYNLFEKDISISSSLSRAICEIPFPIKDFENLLKELGWSQLLEWLAHWNNYGGVNLARQAWPDKTKSDWALGVGLPFLTDIERYLANQQESILFGISGLPGSGKTCFGRWLEAAAQKLGWSLTVLSLDDFYLPSQELGKAMAGNPWNVPRGLPGSHSIELLERCLDIWVEKGILSAPQFDKALRGGLGDRSGWRQNRPQILVIEGWFLGCSTNEDIKNSQFDSTSGITDIEHEYRFYIQKKLEPYQAIWHRFNRIWHLKAIDFYATRDWKIQQEKNMRLERGSSLEGDLLNSFLRMIEVSIPQSSLQSIEADVIVKVNNNREIKWVGKRDHQPI